MEEPANHVALEEKNLLHTPSRDHERMYLYNVTPFEFDELIRLQDNKCLICHDEMQRPVIDHSHVTGAVRGLLCNLCNPALGLFKDSPEILRKAADYLDNAVTHTTGVVANLSHFHKRIKSPAAGL